MDGQKLGGVAVNSKLQKARIGLLLDEPFFGALLLNLKISEQPGIGTMATDSVRLVVDPKFIDSLSPIELKTVLAHEALHCALLHPLRRGDRDPKQWNVAIDYAANCLLAQTNEAAVAKGRPAPFKFPKARPNKLLLIDCDAQVNSVRTFEPGDVLPRDFAGGGGTDFNPVFELLSQDDPPAALVYLTDLDGCFPASEPAYPVIWAATSAQSAPWGEIVRLT